MDHSQWLEELKKEERQHNKFREKAKKVENRYCLEGEERASYNILWANVEILQAALYSQTPKPDVSRRFKDKNPLAREISMVMERALEFSIDSYDFDGVIQPAINNYLVPGCGQVRINYVPYFGEGEPQRIPLEIQVDPETQEESFLRDGKPVEGEKDEQGAFMMEATEEVVFQSVDCSTVPWSRWRWSPAKDWDTVWWVGEDHYLTEDQARKTFVFKSSEEVPLGFKEQGQTKVDENGGGDLAKITEVWDKRTREHFGVVEGLDRKLKFRAGEGEAEDDPLGLSNFWPYPKPLMANVVAGNATPIPDYLFYQEQALEMDTLTNRIQKLTTYLKYRGVSDGSFANLANLAAADDGVFLAIENFGTRFGDGKGLESIMASMPIKELQGVIAWLMQAREEVKQTIYEITGISDIVRGATAASETLGAQQLKGQFANMRLSRRQRIVQQFVREIFRIKAEIIAEQFEPDMLQMMTGIQVTPEMQQIMQSDVLRAFNIDVETDSTILSDQAIEQESRTAVVEAVTQLVERWGVMLVQAPPLIPLAKALVMFQLQAFKSGRMVEDAVEEAFDAISDVATSAPSGMAGAADPLSDPATGNDPGAIPGAGAAGGGGLL